jgi:aerobic C4-dicarboxylate transport protein
LPRPLYKNLTVQVLAAVAIGATIGWVSPHTGESLKPLADGFIRLVRMVVAPIVFLTIAGGIAGMGNLKRVGRVGVKAIVYFEVVTTIALAIGLVVGNVFKPGQGMSTDAAGTAGSPGPALSTADHILNVIPESVVGAFAKGDLLQVLLFSVLFGVALAGSGESGRSLRMALEWLTVVMFRVVGIIVRLAPIGALGAMAATVGKHGVFALVQLLELMGCVYLTMALFVFVVFGGVARLCRVSLWKYLVFIREEILLVLGTSSSESALPRMIEKMERFGCSKEVVRLVIPSGYSFNLDGTSIYLSMAVLFVAQAYKVELSLLDQLKILGVLMLTSKGAAAVTGGGFITLTATAEATEKLPIGGVQILLGVDRFMSEARAITNLIGNGIATVAVSRMEGEFDEERYREAISRRGEKGGEEMLE